MLMASPCSAAHNANAHATYGYTWMLRTVEEWSAANCLKAGTCDELESYLDADLEATSDVVGWWGVSTPFLLLRSDPTPTFSHTAPSTYTPSYKTPDTWDCITIISDFPNTVPAHPFDILPCLTPEPFSLASLLCPWPYSSHHFTEFCPYYTDGDPTELWLTPRPHETHTHTLKHSTFCYKHICRTHYPYGDNR
jgi:hypothetical protein